MVQHSLGERVTLGRTGLLVSRLGIGSSYGPSPRACHCAFDAGVNYFFWGSVRSRGMGAALRELARTHRDELVIVLQTYARSPWMIRRSVENGLRGLGIEFADILLLGWHDSLPSQNIIDTALDLRELGRFRFLALSSHQRPLYEQLLPGGEFDLFHVRYNAAHRGAETEVFAKLPDHDAPGMVSFNNTRWGDLLRRENMPEGYDPPSARDCYRFALSHPAVQVATCGPANDDEMRHALDVLQSKSMDPDELKRMRIIGDKVHSVRSLMSMLT